MVPKGAKVAWFTSSRYISAACLQLGPSAPRCLYTPTFVWFPAAWGSTGTHQEPEATEDIQLMIHVQQLMCKCQFPVINSKSHHVWDDVVKPVSIFSDFVGDVRAPAAAQLPLVALDKMFDVQIRDEPIDLIHHSLTNTNTQSYSTCFILLFFYTSNQQIHKSVTILLNHEQIQVKHLDLRFKCKCWSWDF